MNTFNTRAADGSLIRTTLLSLDAYEADGGTYSDAGNGGEDMLATGDPEGAAQVWCAECQEWRDLPATACPVCNADLDFQRPGHPDVPLTPYRVKPTDVFVCGVRIETREDRDASWEEAYPGDVADALGLAPRSWWLDSCLGWYLLMEWPAEAPLEARCGL